MNIRIMKYKNIKFILMCGDIKGYLRYVPYPLYTIVLQWMKEVHQCHKQCSSSLVTCDDES